jgi:hypothetical protein
MEAGEGLGGQRNCRGSYYSCRGTQDSTIGCEAEGSLKHGGSSRKSHMRSPRAESGMRCRGRAMSFVGANGLAVPCRPRLQSSGRGRRYELLDLSS